MKERFKYLGSLAAGIVSIFLICVFSLHNIYSIQDMLTWLIVPVCGVIYCIYRLFVPEKKKDEENGDEK